MVGQGTRGGTKARNEEQRAEAKEMKSCIKVRSVSKPLKGALPDSCRRLKIRSGRSLTRFATTTVSHSSIGLDKYPESEFSEHDDQTWGAGRGTQQVVPQVSIRNEAADVPAMHDDGIDAKRQRSEAGAEASTAVTWQEVLIWMEDRS